jgi:hypothetical protein
MDTNRAVEILRELVARNASQSRVQALEVIASALALKEDQYQRGYEQGTFDAVTEWQKSVTAPVNNCHYKYTGCSGNAYPQVDPAAKALAGEENVVMMCTNCHDTRGQNI